MVAQSSANFPIFGEHARQRGRGFDALAQTFGRTAIPFIKKYIVPAAKIIGADLFETAASEIVEVVIGRKKFKAFAKNVKTKTIRKQLGGGKKKFKRRTRRAISRKSISKISRFREEISVNQSVIFGTERLQFLLWRFLIKSQFWKQQFHHTHKKYFPVLLLMKAVLSLNLRP